MLIIKKIQHFVKNCCSFIKFTTIVLLIKFLLLRREVMFKKVLSLIIVFAILCTSIVFAAEQPNYNVYEGYQSLKITWRNTDKFLFYGQTLKVEKNTDYTMSIWSKGGGSHLLGYLPAVGQQLLRGKLKVARFGRKIKLPNTANNDIIVFTVTNNPYGGNGTMFVDNAFLAKVSDGVNIVKIQL